jgi:hypothetical protein
MGDCVSGIRVDAHSVHATGFEATADVPSTGSFRSFQLPVQLPGPLAFIVRRFQ